MFHTHLAGRTMRDTNRTKNELSCIVPIDIWLPFRVVSFIEPLTYKSVLLVTRVWVDALNDLRHSQCIFATLFRATGLASTVHAEHYEIVFQGFTHSVPTTQTKVRSVGRIPGHKQCHTMESMDNAFSAKKLSVGIRENHAWHTTNPPDPRVGISLANGHAGESRNYTLLGRKHNPSTRVSGYFMGCPLQGYVLPNHDWGE